MTIFLRISGFFLLLLLIMSQSVSAQLYEPVYRPDVEWKEINTERFRIIFPATAEANARRSLRILESQYDEVQELVGGELKNFPVVINDYNDRTGGLVTTNHFRIEVEAPPRRGKSQNPRTGGWLELVMPHELVHALHFSVVPDLSLARLIRPFAPDLAASFHLTAPLGLAEGIAVYHESNVRPGEGGRGNYPFFTNQITANFDSEERWSIGELVYSPSRTRPGGRHYFGGYALTDWLHEEYGEDTTKEVIERVNQRFFLGYGHSLRTITGDRPGKLEEKFHQYTQQRVEPKLDSIRQAGISPYELVDTGYSGDLISQPKYHPDGELYFYGSFYNERPGLWRISPEVDYPDPEKIYTGTMVENYQYTFESDTSVLFSRQFTHPYHENTWKMDVVRLDAETGDTERLSDRARIHAPELQGDRMWALQTHQETSQWVELTEGEVTDTLLNLYPDNIFEIAANPHDQEEAAVVANINGKQAVWMVDAYNPEINRNQPDLALDGGSIFDVSWHPHEDRVLFTSDTGDVMNVYEWDRDADEIHQLTNTLYNAFDPAYHPDGNSIAFVIQKTSTQELATLDRDDFFNRHIDGETRIQDITEKANRNRIGDELSEESETWEAENYQTGFSWLRPRAIFPIVEIDQTFPSQQFGATVTSGDVLRRNSYELSMSYGAEQLWYDAIYKRRGWYPGFQLRAFSSPVSGANLGMQQQGYSLQTSFPYTLQNNIYFSGITVRPEIRYSRLRAIYDLNRGIFDQPSNWVDQYRSSLRLSANYRLQQNLQDMQPNTGLQLYNEWFAGYSDEWGGSPDYAVSAGIFGYVSPLRRYNQSLRVGTEFQYTDGLVLDQSGFLIPGFDTGAIPDPEGVLRFSTRYTIPIIHSDRAWITIPSQLQSIYAVLFTNTLGTLDMDFNQEYVEQTRTAYGGELRTRFNFFNMTFDAGVRVSYEPTRELLRIGFIL